MKWSKLALAALIASGAMATAQADTVKMECGSGATVRSFCDYVKARFEAETPHKLEFIDMPASSDEKLSMLQQIFATRASNVIDVFAMDVIWPGVIDRHLLDLTDSVKDLEPAFFPSAWQNNVVNGRIKGVPSFIDAGLMFYRSDLLAKYDEKPPETWAELARMAERIQNAEREAGHRTLHGLVFHGKAYEGLTCVALELIASHGGGKFVDADGTITVNNPRAAEALDAAASWIEKIAPRGVLGYQEEEARAVFQNGDSVFMRNWPYAYLLSQDDKSPVKGKVGIMPVPRGGEAGQHAATLGGWQWAVNVNTKVPEASIELVRILAEPETQKRNFMLMGVPPARTDVYQDPEVQAKGPYLNDLKVVFDAAVPRPSTPTRSQYPRVSNAIWNATHDVLSGRSDGTRAVAELDTRLARIKGKDWR